MCEICEQEFIEANPDLAPTPWKPPPYEGEEKIAYYQGYLDGINAAVNRQKFRAARAAWVEWHHAKEKMEDSQ